MPLDYTEDQDEDDTDRVIYPTGAPAVRALTRSDLWKIYRSFSLQHGHAPSDIETAAAIKRVEERWRAATEKMRRSS